MILALVVFVHPVKRLDSGKSSKGVGVFVQPVKGIGQRRKKVRAVGL